MSGILVQLALSWFIIWLYEKNDLRVLGLTPTRERLIDFGRFLLITAACCASGFLLKMYFSDLRWTLNPNLTPGLVLEGVWWNLKSVLFEELIFRGVLLYIVLRSLGGKTAILVSAIAFGIYHWFSFGVLGNAGQMAMVFTVTGIMGLLLAFGYVRTMSLYIPIANHLGWNFTQGFIFSDGPIGTGILQPSSVDGFRTNSYPVFLSVFLVPVVAALGINYLLLKRKPPVNAHIYKVSASAPLAMETGS